MTLFSNLSNLFNQTEKKTEQKKQKSQVKKTQKTKKPVAIPQPQPLKVTKEKTSPKPTSVVPRVHSPIASVAEAEEIIREARAKAKEIIVEAKSEALSIHAQAEAKSRKLMHSLEEQQRSLEKKLDRIDLRLEQLDQREQKIKAQELELEKEKTQLTKLKKQLVQKLEEISGLTKEEAKEKLLENIKQKATREMAQVIKQKEEEAREIADQKAKEIIVDAMKYGATDYVPEYTISVVKLPNEETKGKIIGKAGRNIHAFERITGVDVDLDASPTEVRLSSFDPVRREIARISLERLIKDGRIQPARIEEVVAKVKKEIDKVVYEAGKKLCHDVGVYNLHPDLVKLLGKFKYRFSYGQNLIAHTLEETRIGMKIASELNIDVETVKLGCLLHDIGKVAEEAEGSHVELGVKIAKRYGLPQPVIDAIAQHHEDEPFSGPEQIVVYIADAISGARPGARYENYEEYVARLTKLEEIATKYDKVEQAYAIQAGREIRVLLKPEKSKDEDVVVLSQKIKEEIQNTLTYPGTVTVTVIRETRAKDIAK